ncbi:hypothetical protein MXB_5718, partial [Myxobolus squamalis]
MANRFNIITQIRGVVGSSKSLVNILKHIGLVRIDALQPGEKIDRIPPWINCSFIKESSKREDIRLRDTTTVDKFRA